jgi:exodeoxyribonuclease X
MSSSLIFIDTETTGAGPQDRLIQVAYKTSDGKTVNEFFLAPLPIEIGAMAVHHITNDMIAGKHAFQGSSTEQDLRERFGRSEIFIAHNAPFDIAMIEREGLKVGPFIDTLKVARYLDTKGVIESYALQYLRYLLDIKVEANAHDAWGDILVLEELFYRLLKKIMEQGLSEQDAIKEMIRISLLPTLHHKIYFGKYRGSRIEELAEQDPSYLRWLLKEKEQSTEPEDADWVYTLKHYLHID